VVNVVSTENSEGDCRAEFCSCRQFQEAPLYIEIMTGAKFPPDLVDEFIDIGKSSSKRCRKFDACVRVEDAEVVTPLPCHVPKRNGIHRKTLYAESNERYIQIPSPIPANHNRHRAGEEFAGGDLILRRGEQIGPQRS
jgi:MoeA N-terminal region (domain I and II)